MKEAALGVGQVIVVFPVVVLESVRQEAEGPVVPGVPPDVEVRDGVPPQIAPIDDGAHIGSGPFHRGFQVGQPGAPGADFLVRIGALLPGGPDSVDGSLPVFRHIEEEGAGSRSGAFVEFLLVPVLRHGRFAEGAEQPVEVAHPDRPDGRAFPFAGETGGHAGEQALHRDGRSLRGIDHFPGHGNSSGGDGPGPFRIGRNTVGQRRQVALRTGNGSCHIAHVHQGVHGIGPARFQVQDQGVQARLEMPACGERPVRVGGQGDGRLLRLDVRRRQERAGREVAEARVQGPEDRFRPFPAAGREEQEREDRRDGCSFHDALFIVRSAGMSSLLPSPRPGCRSAPGPGRWRHRCPAALPSSSCIRAGRYSRPAGNGPGRIPPDGW